MRKSGLTSGSLQRLNYLAESSFTMNRRGNWEDEAEGASIEEGLDPTSDDALFSDSDDRDEFDLASESTEQVTEDSRVDYQEGLEQSSQDDKNEDAAFNAEPEPWNEVWELTARKNSYDIRNYYLEGSEGPVDSPLSIKVLVMIETWSVIEDSELNALEDHIQENLKRELKMTPQHHIIVTLDYGTPDAGGTEDGVAVQCTFDGIEPTVSSELETVIEGLVYKSVMNYE